MTFQAIQIDVSKRVEKAGKGVYEKVGEQTIYVPLLQDIISFVTSEIKKDEKTGAPVMEEGIPVYEKDEANWVQAAILAAVKAQNRNKLVPGTATLKDGQKVPETWAELCAEGVRDGSGLALAREFKAAFAEWLSKQGLSDAAQKVLNTLVGNKSALEPQNNATKQKVLARLEAFASSLDAASLEKFMRPLTSAQEACAAADELDF